MNKFKALGVVRLALNRQLNPTHRIILLQIERELLLLIWQEWGLPD